MRFINNFIVLSISNYFQKRTMISKRLEILLSPPLKINLHTMVYFVMKKINTFLIKGPRIVNFLKIRHEICIVLIFNFLEI